MHSDGAVLWETAIDPFLPDTARKARRIVLEALHAHGGGHFGGCGSCIEILLAIFGSRTLLCREGKGDHLLLSKGHASMSLYAILSLLGPVRLPLSEFGVFRSPLQGHPDRQHLPQLDFSFGSLGQGVAAGIGMALGSAARGTHVWVVLGDGECQEGMVWEAAMLAARYNLSNLHVIVDTNGEQECGWAHDRQLEQCPIPNAVAKWDAFGWQSTEGDGHDTSFVASWARDVTRLSASRPSVLIANTSKRLALSGLASRFRRHHTALHASEFERMKTEIETSKVIAEERIL